MIKKMLICLCLMFLTAPAYALAAGATTDQQLFSACDTNASTSSSPICKDQGTTTNPVNHTIKVATDIVALLTGAAAVIIIVVGGISMATSGGNSESVANSRKRIISALIGLVIVALAWTIISFATDRLIK